MSEIRVTTLKDTAGGNASTSADIYSGRAKAWVNFNGSGTVAARASFNVNSINDLAVGNYGINFATALEDANFSQVCQIEYATTTTATTALSNFYDPSEKTSTSTKVRAGQSESNTASDFAGLCVTVFR
jgi:hypothetical protein